MLAATFHVPADAVSTSGGGTWSRPVVDVPPDTWVEALSTARDALHFTFLDWLTAVDETAEGLRVVAHLWDAKRRQGLLLRTLITEPRLDSVVEVFPGAAWHERETFEMFGIDFVGHENLRKLLLPDEFEGHPLRKDFVLAARAIKAWPGAKEPGEGGTPAGGKQAPSRRKLLPPGVPETPWPLTEQPEESGENAPPNQKES
ncbi:MAG: NADH-quinone oxidoreductase subunit C [Corynebacteriales bacterium]|nr:NADH-quinone oxidoreductase subunit C [Mycobacteriales bacterium]